MDHMTACLSSSDIVVLVLGMTGSGKSTFISTLTGQDSEVGHGLESCTAGLGLYSYDYGPGRLYLVDTPGFNDTRRSDVEIVQELSFFLGRVYTSGVRLAGILNLHRISDNRVTGSAVRSFRIIKEICGPEAVKSTVLLTTLWNSLDTGSPDFDAAIQREMELEQTDEFWGAMCRQGSCTRRWFGDKASAHSVIDELITASNRYGQITLRLQRELVDEQLDLDNTCVGRLLAERYGALWQKLSKDLDQLEQGLVEAKQIHSHELAAQLKRQKTEWKKKLQAAQAAEQDLRVRSDELIEDRTKTYARLLHDTLRELEDSDRLCKRYDDEIQELKEYIGRQRRMHLDEQLSLERDRRALVERESAAERQHLALEGEASARRKREEEEKLRARRRRLVMKEKRIAGLKRDEEESLRKQHAVSMKLERARKRQIMKRNLLPILGMLAGVGVIAAGCATVQVPLIAAGIGVLSTAAGKLSLGSGGHSGGKKG